ncbi:MAG: hypothetical protein PHH54_07400 [Candidatus Nanoarchaeia archaeon]|nr:hypothetical protein [Candidatus Nanoarchaeia archaeon]MDD5741781.1 hypothetical protein [Candidatus Nanoarchaeia archaeon]
MKIGVIGPSKLEYLNEINKDNKKILINLAKEVADSGNEIVICPDKGSVSEFFGKEYIKSKGKKIYEVVPLDDKEFGLSWVNLDLGENINCGTWRNQPEKLNEETDILLCVGYAVGVLAEIAYAKWFKPKQIYIIKELVSGKLPKEVDILNLKLKV